MAENSIDSDQGETAPINESNNDEVTERTKILNTQANISFDRFSSSIDKINSKILALFQVFLVLVTIQITIISVILTRTGTFDCLDLLVLSWLAVVTIIAFFSFYYFVWPKNYEHLEMFEEDRFGELCSVSKEKILLDFLYYTRKTYLANRKTYEKLRIGLFASLLLILIDLVLFGIFIVIYLAF